MPTLFRKVRHDSVALGSVHAYLWYAVGEVALIFIGITLALAFGDMQEERRSRVEEISTLNDIARNLQANIKSIESTIDRDDQFLHQCQDAIDIVEARSLWQPEYGTVFEGCRWWTSPYHRSAAFDSLKTKGTDLVSDPEVRSTIVNLYEDVYARNVADMDREQWDFQSSVLLPLWNQFLRTSQEQFTETSNYDALLDSSEFLNMLYNRSELLSRSIETQKQSLASTKEALAAIQTELLRLVPN
jgi:hypothetical protein